MRTLFPRWLGINTTAVLIHSINSWITPSHDSCEFGSIPKKQSKKILLNPAKLAPLLQKTGIVYMSIPLLTATPETPGRFRQAVHTPLSEINSDTFINMNKQ